MSDFCDIFKGTFAVIFSSFFLQHSVNFHAVFYLFLFILITEGEGKLNSLGGNYMISVGRDETLSRFPQSWQCYKLFINYVLHLLLQSFIPERRDPSFVLPGSSFTRTKFSHVIAIENRNSNLRHACKGKFKKMQANLNKYQVENCPAFPERNFIPPCKRRVKSVAAGRTEISSRLQLSLWFQGFSQKRIRLYLSYNYSLYFSFLTELYKNNFDAYY